MDHMARGGGVTIDAQIAAVLDTIHDPCSVAAGRPTSVFAMGLVLGWEMADGVLTVRFAVTFAGCTMAPHFTEAARERLAELPGVDRVVTIVDTAHVWTPPATDVPMTGRPQAWRQRPN
jgi:metal-sulfur cluster biosynthetic enzyme